MKFVHDIQENLLDESKFYLAVVGSRTITDKDAVFDAIENVLTMAYVKFDIPKDVAVILSGGAKGVDSLAEEYAHQNDLESIIISPDYKRFKKSASLKRNLNIIRHASYAILILDINNKSNGTLNAINHAEKLGVPHMIVEYS